MRSSQTRTQTAKRMWRGAPHISAMPVPALGCSCGTWGKPTASSTCGSTTTWQTPPSRCQVRGRSPNARERRWQAPNMPYGSRACGSGAGPGPRGSRRPPSSQGCAGAQRGAARRVFWNLVPFFHAYLRDMLAPLSTNRLRRRHRPGRVARTAGHNAADQGAPAFVPTSAACDGPAAACALARPMEPCCGGRGAITATHQHTCAQHACHQPRRCRTPAGRLCPASRRRRRSCMGSER